jgi:hypothetical protein
MAADLIMPRRHFPHATRLRSALSALGAGWAAYTVKRAIAGVASTSDRAYRDCGLDKAELLVALKCLREHVVANRKPGLLDVTVV